MEDHARSIDIVIEKLLVFCFVKDFCHSLSGTGSLKMTGQYKSVDETETSGMLYWD